jgi:hypothetical protein
MTIYKQYFGRMKPEECRQIVFFEVRSFLASQGLDPRRYDYHDVIQILDNWQVSDKHSFVSKFAQYLSIRQLNTFYKDWEYSRGTMPLPRNKRSQNA